MVRSKRQKTGNQYADDNIPHYGPDSSLFTMENHQVNGDVSVDKGKKVALECNESDREHQPDCESNDYDMFVDSDYESEYDDMLYHSYVDNEVEWTGNQVEVSQTGGSQAAVSQYDVSQARGSQAAVNQTVVSQGGGNQAIVKGSSCFE
ncbi:unnamed protein product [Ilex paraguariensis]|uniref:Uncharacterized protein n=1 Tax=Ilex paraguariensis TaxID=185542 RepID=A0ABC8SU58_9AQUA